jgi:esterase/lipase
MRSLRPILFGAQAGKVIIVKNSLSNINQTIWELKKKINKKPESLNLRKELVRLYHESSGCVERMNGVPEQDRSFLMLQERESLCCMLIHGGGGSPNEMLALGEHLFGHGYTVYGIKLPLSGPSQYARAGAQLKGQVSWKKRINDGITCSWSSCLSASEITLETLLDYTPNTYVVGFSFGGTIAINLLKQYAVKGGILISPALVPTATARSAAFRAIRKIAPPVARRLAPIEDTMLDLMERTRTDSAVIQQPLLVIQAKDDPVLSIKGFALLRNLAPDPRSSFVLLERGGHVLVASENAPEVFSMCSDFIKEA